VGLAHRKNHRPNELSGGEQQRVTVARALAGEPAIVWADEPTGNLDTETAGQVMDLLHELNRDGLTLVLVTHDPAIGATASRLIRMRDGEIESSDAQQAGAPGVQRS
jgi:putative ABC transport system ATP-binding protein